MTRSLFLIFLIVCITGCKKSKSLSQPQDPADSTAVVDPVPEDTSRKGKITTTMYYGETEAPIHAFFYTDSFKVITWERYGRILTFHGNGVFGSQQADGNSQNEYRVTAGKDSYFYKITQDSLYVTFWKHLGGGEGDEYIFRGKKKE